MKKKDEIAHFDKEWEDMKTHLKSFLNDERQEDLHHFRVQVKKLYAFLILADSAKRHPELIKLFKPIRTVFKKAGEIRNAYLNLELGKAHQKQMDEFLIAQHELLNKAIAAFKLDKDKHLEKIKRAYKKLVEKITPVDDIHISLFYINHLEHIAGSLAELKFNDELHDSRTLVKNLIYNHKLVHAKLAVEFNEDYLQDIQTAIGDWHDNIDAITLFSGDGVMDKQTVTNLKKQDIKYKSNIKLLVKDFYNRATTAVETLVEQVS